MELVAPGISVPFNFHWYVGLRPPFVICAAEKVTDVPWQIVVAEAWIFTVGATDRATAIGILFDGTLNGFAQETDELMTTDITSSFASVEL